MYLSELKIWNFRKFGLAENNTPGLHLKFDEGLNLLVGENDSGKTAIVDAIKFVLQTQSFDYNRLEYEDFFLPQDKDRNEENRTTILKIECIFRGFKDDEAKNFLEWLGIEDNGGNKQYFLKVFLNAERKERRVIYDIKAGADDEGTLIEGEARNLLRTTYLKPLRDAENELIPGRRSRLAQILNSHEAFSQKEGEHTILKIMKKANKSIENYFSGIDEEVDEIEDQRGKALLRDINSYLEEFFTNREPNKQAKFSITDQELKNILEKLTLDMTETKAGLGSYNRLYIAVELLLLKRKSYTGLKLALIEEIEAHLHPQAQLRLIEYLQTEVAGKEGVQLIITTHSPNLASKVKLENLILCKNGNAFPMGSGFTDLEKGDYLFLERFLDTTKANLFFAQGVILVEGNAENILVPVIAEVIGKPLSKYGVSVVNVQSTAFLIYSRIFKRTSGNAIGIKVAVITDNDNKPNSGLNSDEISRKRSEKKERYNGQDIDTYISPDWTLEYDIALGGFKKEIYTAILQAEKIQNSDRYGLTEEKVAEINRKVQQDLVQWEKDGKSDTDIANEIYQNYMFSKEISKAITAQCFANLLLADSNREGLKSRILTDVKLKYIIDAINYVTG